MSKPTMNQEQGHGTALNVRWGFMLFPMRLEALTYLPLRTFKLHFLEMY